MSAFKDSRFSPIIKEELRALTYKVNYLEEPFAIDPTKESIVERLEVGLHGITITFSDGGNATYLASVLPEAFGITEQNISVEIDKVIDSLRKKSGSSGEISKVELYRCVEIVEIKEQLDHPLIR